MAGVVLIWVIWQTTSQYEAPRFLVGQVILMLFLLTSTFRKIWKILSVHSVYTLYITHRYMCVIFVKTEDGARPGRETTTFKNF